MKDLLNKLNIDSYGYLQLNFKDFMSGPLPGWLVFLNLN